MTTYDPHIHGDSSDVEALKNLLAKVSAPGVYDRLIQMLKGHTDYGDNVVRCTYCGESNMPVTMTEGGTSPEYACPICYARGLIAESEVAE